MPDYAVSQKENRRRTLKLQVPVVSSYCCGNQNQKRNCTFCIKPNRTERGVSPRLCVSWWEDYVTADCPSAVVIVSCTVTRRHSADLDTAPTRHQTTHHRFLSVVSLVDTVSPLCIDDSAPADADVRLSGSWCIRPLVVRSLPAHSPQYRCKTFLNFKKIKTCLTFLFTNKWWRTIAAITICNERKLVHLIIWQNNCWENAPTCTQFMSASTGYFMSMCQKY